MFIRDQSSQEQGPSTDSGKPGRDPRRELGRAGEELALKHLQARGFQLLAKNHRTRYGEIDLIVFDGSVLVFVEVKTRQVRRAHLRSERQVTQGLLRPRGAPVPLEGLRHIQRARLRRLASAWLRETASAPRARQLRFDAIGVLVDGEQALLRLDHVEDAW
jgi:putative endonuclease